MTTDPGSDGWYWDERDNPDVGYVWTYGKEVWCNMQGQYVHIVADLTHLIPPYKMSLCNIGIMGASYIRDQPLTEFIEIFEGESIDLTVSHIFNEFSEGTLHDIKLRVD